MKRLLFLRVEGTSALIISSLPRETSDAKPECLTQISPLINNTALKVPRHDATMILYSRQPGRRTSSSSRALNIQLSKQSLMFHALYVQYYNEWYSSGALSCTPPGRQAILPDLPATATISHEQSMIVRPKDPSLSNAGTHLSDRFAPATRRLGCFRDTGNSAAASGNTSISPSH